MDVIDYEVFGNEMQYVELELDPGEAAIGEAGSMFYMDPGIDLDTVFGDGSAQSSGLFGALLGAGKRLVTGESLFTTIYTNRDSIKRRVAFAAPYPGKIVPVDLSRIGGTLVAQRDAFLCAARGVSLGIAFQRKLGTGFFGGEGFIMERLDGDGMVFVHAGGTILERQLAPGEMLRVDTGCVVAYQPTVDFDVQYWDGSNWITVPGGSITGNNLVWRKLSFAAVSTSAIRITVHNALGTWSRLAEIEAWTAN